jgi:hypothetical protein
MSCCLTNGRRLLDCLAEKREVAMRLDLRKAGQRMQSGETFRISKHKRSVNVVVHDRSILDRHAQFAGTAARPPLGQTASQLNSPRSSMSVFLEQHTED